MKTRIMLSLLLREKKFERSQPQSIKITPVPRGGDREQTDKTAVFPCRRSVTDSRLSYQH